LTFFDLPFSTSYLLFFLQALSVPPESFSNLRMAQPMPTQTPKLLLKSTPPLLPPTPRVLPLLLPTVIVVLPHLHLHKQLRLPTALPTDLKARPLPMLQQTPRPTRLLMVKATQTPNLTLVQILVGLTL
jgi:hypothetical protein